VFGLLSIVQATIVPEGELGWTSNTPPIIRARLRIIFNPIPLNADRIGSNPMRVVTHAQRYDAIASDLSRICTGSGQRKEHQSLQALRCSTPVHPRLIPAHLHLGPQERDLERGHGLARKHPEVTWQTINRIGMEYNGTIVTS
jgi:hypothetical protein